MGRAPKPIGMNRGHRTKAEIEDRKAWETALDTGDTMQPNAEVKANPEAAKLFRRLKKMFAKVEMDDALYESGLNRYCLMTVQASKLQKERDAMDVTDPDTAALAIKKDASISKINDQLLAWEKENLMTVQAKLRTIPKAPKKEDTDNVTGIAAFMRRQG